MEKGEVQNMAFMMIAYAGSAFDHFYRAIEYARHKEFDKSDEEMNQGTSELNNAHRSQASLLTAEVNAEDIPFSVIMTHAQDHLTMAIFSQRIANEFIYLYKERKEQK